MQKELNQKNDCALNKFNEKLDLIGAELGDKFGLDVLKTVLSQLDNPQNAYKTIHIAGTNGKTTTSRAIETILLGQGLKTGRYTSPHINLINERICINGSPADGELLLKISDKLDAKRKDACALSDAQEQTDIFPAKRLSYFEYLTLIAFLAFKKENIDVASIECGLGGRLDATNVINSSVQVITSIDFDHIDYLGNSLKKIAFEKASIIKPSSACVIQKQKKEVLKTIKDYAKKQNAACFIEGVHWYFSILTKTHNGQIIKLKTPKTVYHNLFIPLLGKFHAQNISAAIVACETFLNKKLDIQTLQNSLSQISSPGKFEIIKHGFSDIEFDDINKYKLLTILLDGAHNPNGVQNLIKTLKKEIKYDIAYGIFGCMKDKDWLEMLKISHKFFKKLIILDIASSRSLDVNTLYNEAQKYYKPENIIKALNAHDAVAKSKELILNAIYNKKNGVLKIKNKKILLICFGSIYILQNIKNNIK